MTRQPSVLVTLSPCTTVKAGFSGEDVDFWTSRDKSALTAGNARDEERPELLGRMSTISQISRLTDERSDEGRENGT